MAFVVDSGYSSVYEFDIDRRRFLGPAPTLPGLPLPGYPTVLGRFAPQKAAIIGEILYVADGGGASIAAVPFDTTGLGTPRLIHLPRFQVRLRPSSGGRLALSAPPFLDRITVLPSGRLLVVGEDEESGLGLAYSVDPSSGAVSGTLQLPIEYGYAQASAHSGSTTLLATDQRQLLMMRDDPLRIEHVYQLPGKPRGMVVVGGSAYVTVDAPARLVKVDLGSGDSTVVDQALEPLSFGGVILEGNSLWWAVRSGVAREVSLEPADGRQSFVATFPICREPASLAYSTGVLLAVCSDERLALVDIGKHRTWFTRAGDFPFDVVVPTG